MHSQRRMSPVQYQRLSNRRHSNRSLFHRDSPCYHASRSATGTSAAQNGPVIRICSKCGALLLEETERCSFCETPLAENNEILQPVTSGEGVSEEPAEPEWRREVSRRLEQYRARHGRS